ncbi:uncharacterized protein LOC134817140 [Bolinopsis microptera]|uniref:uncharacterized protein LOC134817140 n=1 Tax=Bolinopsis microptera TaxID=2820187 RepID=UPI003079B8A6
MDAIIMIKYIALLGGVILLTIPLISNYSSTSTSNLPQISRSHKHGTILFFKELFDEDQKNQLRELRSALFGGYWRYYDHEHTPKDGISWQLPVDAALLSQSPFWNLLNEIIPDNESQGSSEHVDARARVLRRGDNVKIHSVCNEQESGYTIVLFLSQLKDRNDYGEVLFFQDNDVHTTLQPKQYSVLVWSCRIPYQFQYPSISTGFGQVLLQITMYNTVDVKPAYLPHSVKHFPIFQGVDAINKTFRAEDHVTTVEHTALNRPIYVLDNLFREDMLVELREHLYMSSQYYYDDSDDEGETDNVQWISGHRTSEFVKSEMWAVVNQTLNQITGHEGWYPYDVSCNLNRAWDHTRIHKDCYDKDEYTFLLYLNPEFKPGHLGGTVYYEHEDLSNIVMSVQNRYGRVALFHCEIKHAGRPPHAYLTNARYSFAVKVARTKLEAVQREMQQSLWNDLDDEDKPEEMTKLTEEVGSDPDLLENKFVDYFEEELDNRLNDLETALKTAGGS